MKNFNVTSMLVMLMFMCITSMQAQSITPSKKYITKELNNVSNFSSIRVLGSPDVEYRQSSDSKTTVSIYGSDNLVDLLEVSTVNGVLQVNIKKGVKILSGERRLKVIASSPSLDDVDIKGSADVYLKGTLKGADLNLNITGSGDIEAENLQYTNLSAFIKGSGDIDVKNVKATTVKTIVSGSGDVKMKGSTQTAMLTVNGSGDISADKLTATNVVATVSGSGDISCYASKQLDAKASGSGDIEYKGIPSYGWGARCRRICTWGYFKDLRSGKKFYVFNSHTDHEATEARRQSSFMLLEQVRKIAKGRPTFCTGDFNATPDEEPVQLLLKDSLLLDSYKCTLTPPKGPSGSFYAYDKTGKTAKRIDFIFVTPKIKILSYHTIDDDIKYNKYSSDHFPVMVEALLK